MRTERIIQQHLERASRQWKWLRFLRHSATLGIVVTTMVLLLGVAIACGWLTSGGVVTACVVLLVAGAILALALLGLIVTTSQPEQDELARAIERAHPALMNRLNTLVFLGRLRETPSVRSFYRRIEGQANSALAGQVPTAPFSWAQAVARLCGLAALVIVTAWFYFQFKPLAALTTATAQLHGDKAQSGETFEIPPAEPEPESAKDTAPWGEVRITDPGRDLTATSVENIPLQIEASASEPVKSVEWYTAINGGDQKKRPLPSPTDPRYAVYDPVIELKKFGLSDWDVLEYHAKATTERGDSFVSKAYFVEIQPFREELCQLPGGQEGKCYSLLNQMSGLIERQQQVIRQTHRQQYSPDETPDMQAPEPQRLAEIEDQIATATAHLAAKIAAEFSEATVEKPLSHLDRAQESLGKAAEAFRERALSQAQPQARASLAEMVQARKQFQRCIDGNPGAFTAQDEGDSGSEPAESLQKISEFCDKAKAAVEFVQELAERQRGIAKGTGLSEVSHRTTFTTGLDSRNRPVDSITEISMREKRVYLYTSWRGLSYDEHKHVCKMFDGEGKIVGQPQMNFTANPDVCNTWSWHDFDQSKDKPGTWRFEVYLDGQEVIEKTLEVRPTDELVRAGLLQQANDNSVRSVERKELRHSGTTIALGQELDISGPTLEGKYFDLNALRGKVVLVDFWATWCKPCVNEMPHVKAVYHRYHKRGFEVVGVSLDRSREKLAEFVEEKQIPWPQIIFDEDDSRGWNNPLALKYGIRSIPSMFLVDQDGKVSHLEVRGSAIEKAVAELLGKESMFEVFSAWMDEPAFKSWIRRNLDGVNGAYVSAVEGRLHKGVEQFRARLAQSLEPMRWFWWYGMNEEEYQQRVVKLTEKDTFKQNQLQIFINVEGRPVYQAVFTKDMGQTSRAESLPRKEDNSFRLIKHTLYGQLALDEDVLRKEFDTFERQHPRICRFVPKECTEARQELKRASEALWHQHDEAQHRAILAAARLDRLAEALTKQTSAQQLANAYKLKSMLDEQVNLLERLEQEPDAATAQELDEACRNMKEITGGLKRTAEEKPTSEFFGQKLRETLSDENKRNLDSLCDSLCRAQGGEARKRAAGAAKAGLQEVSQAFTESQPQLLAELQKEDTLQPAGQRSLDRGIKQLEGLLEFGRDGRRLSAEDTKKLQQEALTNIEKGIEDLDSGAGSTGRTYKALREFYRPDVTVDPKVIQQLIAQLENLSVELVEVQGEEPGEPEIYYIDPEKLPQAYRERIRKYYEKLSEQ